MLQAAPSKNLAGKTDGFEGFDGKTFSNDGKGRVLSVRVT
jgi:hypothetical protein